MQQDKYKFSSFLKKYFLQKIFHCIFVFVFRFNSPPECARVVLVKSRQCKSVVGPPFQVFRAQQLRVQSVLFRESFPRSQQVAGQDSP